MSNTVVPPRVAATVQAAETPGLNGLLTLCVGVVVVASLYLARELLIPITLAILLSFVLTPIVELLRRIRIPHVAAVLLAVVIAFGAIGAIGGVIGLQVAGLASDIPQYAVTIQKKIDAVRGATFGRVAGLLARLDRQVKPQIDAPPEATVPEAEPTIPGPGANRLAATVSGPQPMPVQMQPQAETPLAIARRVLVPVVAPLSDFLIIIIIAVFVLMQREDLRDRLIRLFGSSDLHRTTVAMDDAARRLSQYFLAQLAINSSFGLIISVGLWFIGVPSPLLWGALSGLLRFVPYVGPIIGGLLPAAMAAAVSPGWSMVVWTAGLYVAVELVTGQVIEPLIYGHSTGLSPTAVIIAAIFWTWIWGPIGLVLSTPLTLCMVVLGRHVERMEFLDVLLGDRPALTPVENFYQRMLAQDPDETQHQAELLLKERSLTAYYDEVAIKGLQLAANDAQRGVLSEDRVEFIKTSVKSLIAELGSYADADPHPGDKEAAAATSPKAEREVPSPAPPAQDAPANAHLAPAWQGSHPVMCLSGRGPLDEAACAMLAQLLSKHGLDAKVVSHAASSRENIDSLDVSGVAIICLSYLEISGSPSHLHYLVRRLHAHAPDVPVLVGFWPTEDQVMQDKRLLAVIGADFYTTSLKQTVETCVTEAHTAAGSKLGDQDSVGGLEASAAA